MPRAAAGRALPFSALVTSVLLACGSPGGGDSGPAGAGGASASESGGDGAAGDSTEVGAEAGASSGARGGGGADPAQVAPDPGPLVDPPAPEAVVVEGASFPRATARAEVVAKGAKHVMIHEKIGQGLFALAAQPVTAEWSASAAGPELARDDNLLTAWTCTPTPDRSCALGLAFPEPAELRAIRFFGADGSGREAYRDHPRVASVRLHTDAGWMDATVTDGEHYRWVQLDAPVETSRLVVEVTGTHGPEGQVQLAEIEAFGTAGKARAPLHLDPSRTWISFVDKAWGGSDAKQGIRRPYLQTLGTDGEPRRIDHGTAIYGRSDDRFALVEWLYGTDCEKHGLTYLLVDKQTRMWFHVGTLGNAVGLTRRRVDGLGFAVGEAEGSAWGVGLDPGGGKVTRERPDRVNWGSIEAVVQPRGGDRGGRTLLASGCAPADELGELRRAGVEAAAAWTWARCEVGARRVWLGQGDDCGTVWTVHVVDDGGALLKSVSSGNEPGRAPRFQRTSDGALLVEVHGRSTERTELWRVAAEGELVELGDGALAIRRPAVCEACSGAF